MYTLALFATCPFEEAILKGEDTVPLVTLEAVERPLSRTAFEAHEVVRKLSEVIINTERHLVTSAMAIKDMADRRVRVETNKWPLCIIHSPLKIINRNFPTVNVVIA